MLVQAQTIPVPPRVSLSGEVDCAITPQLQPHLLEMAAGTPGPSVSFDCAGLTFIDASGVNMLLEVADRSGKPVRLVNLAPGCRRVFEILGLCARFGIEDAAPAGEHFDTGIT